MRISSDFDAPMRLIDESDYVALREIVEAVAAANNGDNSVCFRLCNVHFSGTEKWGDEVKIHHDAPCVVEMARAFLASRGCR